MFFKIAHKLAKYLGFFCKHFLSRNSPNLFALIPRYQGITRRRQSCGINHFFGQIFENVVSTVPIAQYTPTHALANTHKAVFRNKAKYRTMKEAGTVDRTRSIIFANWESEMTTYIMTFFKAAMHCKVFLCFSV